MKNVIVILFVYGLTLNAQNWTLVSSGLTGNIWGIDYADSDNVWICDGNSVARSTDGGSTWISAGNAGQGAFSVAAINDTTAIIALGPNSGDGKIMRTTDGGTTWTQVYTAAGAWFNFVDNISSTDLWALSDPIDSVFHIVKSTDGGVTWTVASNLPSQPASNVWGALGSFYRIGNTCWFGTGGSNSTLANRVYKSTNGPDGPWTFSNLSDQAVGSVAFSSGSGAGIAGFWGIGTLVNLSSDGGTNWTSQVTAIGGTNGLDYIQGTHWAWAATSSGIYKTSNNGIDWVQDLVEVNMYAIKFYGDANIGLAGGFGGKLYKSTNNSVLPVEVDENVPLIFSLEQNFPNPFNPSTTFRYSVPQTSQVIIKIFDVLGNQIQTLVNEEKPAGNYEVTWYANNLPSGVYFFRLQAGDFTSVKKMILMK